MAFKGIQQEGITMATESHSMGPCDQITTWCTKHLTGTTPPTHTRGGRGSMEICQETSGVQHHMTFMKPIHSELLCEEGQKAMASIGLLNTE
jgi:hypothetical protein